MMRARKGRMNDPITQHMQHPDPKKEGNNNEATANTQNAQKKKRNGTQRSNAKLNQKTQYMKGHKADKKQEDKKMRHRQLGVMAETTYIPFIVSFIMVGTSFVWQVLYGTRLYDKPFSGTANNRGTHALCVRA